MKYKWTHRDIVTVVRSERNGAASLTSLLIVSSGHGSQKYFLGRVDGHGWDDESERLRSVLTNFQSEDNESKPKLIFKPPVSSLSQNG